MSDPGTIKYVLHSAIDRQKWDHCLAGSENGLVYAESKYLDTMAVEWDALVLGDYETIMPLPRRKKWGIQYIFQPFLTPALGVFGKKISETLVGRFLDSIPRQFRLWDISLNSGNSVNASYRQQFKRKNYLLPLNQTYEAIASRYSENVTRNIDKALKKDCTVKKNIPFEDLLSICKREFPRFTKVEPGTFARLSEVSSVYQDSLITYGVYSKDNVLLSSAAFLTYRQRTIYWLAGNNYEARNSGSSHLLIDQFIKENAAKDLVLDFEGSDQPSIAEFYQRFGAKPEMYTSLYRQRLPFPLNWIKKRPAYYDWLEKTNAT